MNIFKKIRASLRLREAMRQADNAHRMNGHRYYVMPTTGTSAQLVIMDRNNFRKLKQKRYLPSKALVRDLERECFYCTPYRNGSGELSAEEAEKKYKQYFAWLEMLSKLK